MAQTEAQRQWYLKNKERLLKKAKVNREENKERIRAYQKVWCKNNPDKIKGYGKNYRENNYEEIYNRHKEWVSNNKEANREHKKKWVKENPEKIRAKDAKRRCAKLNATMEGYDKELNEIYEDCYMISLVMGDYYEVDHIVPLQGKNVCGLHVPWNLQILHRTKNRSKGNKYE